MRKLALAMTAMLLLGCATSNPMQRPTPDAPDPKVVVDNQSWDRQTIYAVGGPQGRQRLGAVPASSEQTFEAERAWFGQRMVDWLLIVSHADPVYSILRQPPRGLRSYNWRLRGEMVGPEDTRVFLVIHEHRPHSNIEVW